MADIDKILAPTGVGYIFHLEGVHYHNDPNDKNMSGEGEQYVDFYFLKKLQEWSIERDGQTIPVRAMGITHPVIMESVDHAPFTFDPEGRPQQGSRDAFTFGQSPGPGAGMQGPGGPGGGPGGPGGGGGPGGPGGGPGGPLGGAQNPLGPAASGVSAGDVRNLKKQSEQESEQKKLERIRKTWFSIEFVWQPTYGEKRGAFNVLHHFLKESPDADFLEAQKNLREKDRLDLTEDQFKEYQSKHTTKGEAPQADPNK